jgi:hypothetical protein
MPVCGYLLKGYMLRFVANNQAKKILKSALVEVSLFPATASFRYFSY